MAMFVSRILVVLVVFMLGTSLVPQQIETADESKDSGAGRRRKCKEARNEIYRCLLSGFSDLRGISNPQNLERTCRAMSELVRCMSEVNADQCQQIQTVVGTYTTFMNDHCSGYDGSNEDDDGGDVTECPASASEFMQQIDSGVCGDRSEIAQTRLNQCRVYYRILSCVQDRVDSCSGESWMTEDVIQQVDVSMEEVRIGQMTIGCNV